MGASGCLNRNFGFAEGTDLRCRCFFHGSGRTFQLHQHLQRRKDDDCHNQKTADLRKIVTKFARIWQKNGDFFLAPGVHPSYEIGFDLISEYIDSHYFEELTVEKLAAMCNMSHSTFSMNFYRRYNMTCKEYITATRINAAENMLLFSSHDISFIAREVGYTDCSYFIRCYKKLKGITPKQARKLQLGR